MRKWCEAMRRWQTSWRVARPRKRPSAGTSGQTSRRTDGVTHQKRREEGGESLTDVPSSSEREKVRRASAPAFAKPGHSGYGWLARSKALKVRSSDDVAGRRVVGLERARRLRSRARTRGSCHWAAPGICDAVRYCAREPVMLKQESLTRDKLGEASFTV